MAKNLIPQNSGSILADVASVGLALGMDVARRTPAGVAYTLVKNAIAGGATSLDDIIRFTNGEESGRDLLKALGGSLSQALIGSAMDILLPKTLSAVAKTGLGKSALNAAGRALAPVASGVSKLASEVVEASPKAAAINKNLLQKTGKKFEQLSYSGTLAKHVNTIEQSAKKLAEAPGDVAARQALQLAVIQLAKTPPKGTGMKSAAVKTLTKVSLPEAQRTIALNRANDILSSAPDSVKAVVNNPNMFTGQSLGYFNTLTSKPEELGSMLYRNLDKIRNTALSNPDKAVRIQELAILDPIFNQRMKGKNIAEGLDNIMTAWTNPSYREGMGQIGALGDAQAASRGIETASSLKDMLPSAADIIKMNNRVRYSEAPSKLTTGGLGTVAGLMQGGLPGAATGFAIGTGLQFLGKPQVQSGIGYGLAGASSTIPQMAGKALGALGTVVDAGVDAGRAVAPWLGGKALSEGVSNQIPLTLGEELSQPYRPTEDERIDQLIRSGMADANRIEAKLQEEGY